MKRSKESSITIVKRSISSRHPFWVQKLRTSLIEIDFIDKPAPHNVRLKYENNLRRRASLPSPLWLIYTRIPVFHYLIPSFDSALFFSPFKLNFVSPVHRCATSKKGEGKKKRLFPRRLISRVDERSKKKDDVNCEITRARFELGAIWKASRIAYWEK